MGWRFRRSFKVIPGVRLNLSKSGVSASIGGAPFTLNVGRRGLLGTVSIPGTGISYRHHVGSTPRTRQAPPVPFIPAAELDKGLPPTVPHVPPPSPAPVLLPTSSAPIEEVRSASTEFLTSESLKGFKHLMQMAYEEREDITRQLDAAKWERKDALRRYESWKRGFILKRLFKDAFAKRKEASETSAAKVAELEEQLRQTTVTTQIEIDKEQAEPYFRMRDDFAALCECAVIWDIKTHQATDRFHERTTAAMKVIRQRVTFALDMCDLINWEQKVPHLRNSKDGDIYLYPGFILYRAAKEAFSVINYHDVDVNGAGVEFHENEGVPADASVVGQTWAKANKDGSPDRRFANNYQIPVALYGQTTFKSGTGLWEEFQFSNSERMTRFLLSLQAFESSFSAARTQGDS